MHYTTLGRTGLKVSVAGLGCGGNSRLGLGRLSSDQSADLVRAAIDQGINLIDTAAAYGTEEIVGEAVAGRPRDSVVISTKAYVSDASGPFSGARVIASLEASLRRLRTDYVDVFHLHGLPPRLYDHAMTEIMPALRRAKADGKLRHIAVSETSPRDPEHAMLARAVEDPAWEVVMLGFHMLSQNARPQLARCLQNGVGTLCMFAVRNIFSRPGLLQQTIRELSAAGKLPAALAEDPDPLGFLIHASGAESLTDAAYRFARHEPGIDVVLFGTGSREHLAANIRSLLRPPLPAADVARLGALFGHLVGVGFDLPDHVQKAAVP
ncbi:MAG: aldo/keto reductase [Hyphomicrobiaceae bacterium]|nr:aldo/keto reductase [Hyphomicrobiaceae bacterium]